MGEFDLGNEPRNGSFYLPRPSRITGVSKFTESETLLRLSWSDGAAPRFTPGQFIQISVLGYGEAPISICSAPGAHSPFEVCIRTAGNTTRVLHDLEVGDWAGIRGPYGNGFPVSEMEGRDVLVVAAGIGIAPARSLVHYIRDHRDRYRRLIVVYGTRHASDILFREDIRAWTEDSGVELWMTLSRPDERWSGLKGRPTEHLRRIDLRAEETLAAVIGPPAIYRYVAMELFDRGMEARQIFVSLERNFQCGIGKCGHCQLNDLYVCRDGPVFRYSTLLGRTEALEAWAPENDQD